MTQETQNSKEKNDNESLSGIELRPYTKKELRNLYGISVTTFRKWFAGYEELSTKDKFKRLFTVKEVEFIFKTFGIPQSISRK